MYKSCLNLVNKCRSLSYDALTAHVAIVFARYMMIVLEYRKENDDLSLCKLFFLFTDELADLMFAESFRLIMKTMTE